MRPTAVLLGRYRFPIHWDQQDVDDLGQVHHGLQEIKLSHDQRPLALANSLLHEIFEAWTYLHHDPDDKVTHDTLSRIGAELVLELLDKKNYPLTDWLKEVLDQSLS